MRSPSTRTLLLDLTPLDTPTRHRGTGRYVHELALGLAKLPSHEIGDLRVLGLTRLGLDGSYRITEDLSSFSGSVRIPTQRDHYRWAYARRIALFRAVRHIGAQAIHLGDPNATPLFWGLSCCRKLVTCHDLIPVRYPGRYFGYKDGGRRLGLAIERRRYRSADRVVAISDATRTDLHTLLQIDPARIVRVYNGVDVERWTAEPPLEQEPTLGRMGLGRRPFALYAGGLHWHKNVEGMMGGVAQARASGIDLELAWAGYLQPAQVEAVEAIARSKGIGGAFRRLGFVTDDELAVLYRAARAHLLVSRAEGFGLTVVEAMASGCPVVTTQGGSLAEVAGDAALTVDPDDHAAIGAALARLCNDSALRAELTARGHLRALSFSRVAQAQAMVRVYRDVLDI